MAEVLTGFPGVRFEERSIVGDPELERQYAEEIPVVLIDDRVHTIWRVDRERLVRALASAPSAGPVASTGSTDGSSLRA